MPIEERFWLYVEKTETCWNWTGGKSEGYGMFKISNHPRTMRGAHRVSYEMHAGPIPAGKVIDSAFALTICGSSVRNRMASIRLSSLMGGQVYAASSGMGHFKSGRSRYAITASCIVVGSLAR
jgi:hypothetical protein